MSCKKKTIYITYPRHPAAETGSHETCRRHTWGLSVHPVIRFQSSQVTLHSRITLHRIDQIVLGKPQSFWRSMADCFWRPGPLVPIWLQPLRRRDGLSPKPFRHTAVPRCDVASRPPCTPVPLLAATSRIYLHWCHINFRRLSNLQFVRLENKQNKDNIKENRWKITAIICVPYFVLFKNIIS